MAIPVPATQASSGISPQLRNDIYSALLSGSGIRAIESTLDEALRVSGFRDNLKTYLTHLFRSGQATTADEAYKLAMQRIQDAMADPSSSTAAAAATTTTATPNGAPAAADDDTSLAGDAEAANLSLKVPNDVIAKGTKVVMLELAKVCDITYDEDT